MTGIEDMLDLPSWVDAIITACFFCLTIAHGQRIAALGSNVDRWMQLLGWCGLFLWWGARLIFDGSIRATAPGALFVLLIGFGSIIAIRNQIKIIDADIRCMNDKEKRCFREDRVRRILDLE